MQSRRTPLGKIILAAVACRGLKASSHSPDARVRETSRQAFSDPFVGSGLERQIRFTVNRETPSAWRTDRMWDEPTSALHSTAANAKSGVPAKILALLVEPPRRPALEGQ